MPYCKICNSWDCDKHNFSVGKVKNIETVSGSSPPEIFVGRWNYPNVYTGILAPEEHGDTSILSSPEVWHSNKLTVNEILENRNKLIYGRSQSSIKKITKFTEVMQEVAMADKSISTEFKLKRPLFKNHEHDMKIPLINHAGEIKSVSLQENTSVKPKVDYLVNDSDVKSTQALVELDSSGIETSTLSKLLSAGLLGKKINRKLVPTRWSITAVDDTLSKKHLEKIRNYPEIKEIQLFHAEYVGNHYEFLLLPGSFSFEVIEISLKNKGIWHDYETNFPRKAYADEVTGAYYANRLALTEYLEKIKRQANCIVFREIKESYTAPLGVGILRQLSREALNLKPEKPNTKEEALNLIQTRINLSVEEFTRKSVLLAEYGKQKKLFDFT